jgi:hemolysin III
MRPQTFRLGLPRHVLCDRIVLTVTAGFSIIALLLLAWESLGLDATAGFGGLLYGVSLTACATSSLVYNAWYKHDPASPWRAADHVCIFLLIAGTYTPFALVGHAGSFLLGPIWFMAALGIMLKLLLRLRFDRWFIAFYLAMGWLVLAGVDRIAAVLPPTAFTLLLVGGLVYTAGVVFYVLDQRMRWASTLWHSAVLLAQISHFAAIFGWIMPVV